MGRSSRGQADANRARIVAVASELFRAHGLEAVGVADVMKAAGMTQGGFYRHFQSKNALAAEACKFAFDSAADNWLRLGKAAVTDGHNAASRIRSHYLRPKPAEMTCPMIALAADVSRCPSDDPLRQAYGAGVQALFTTFTGFGDADQNEPLKHQFESMIGAALIAHALPEASSLEHALAERKAP